MPTTTLVSCGLFFIFFTPRICKNLSLFLQISIPFLFLPAPESYPEQKRDSLPEINRHFSAVRRKSFITYHNILLMTTTHINEFPKVPCTDPANYFFVKRCTIFAVSAATFITCSLVL